MESQKQKNYHSFKLKGTIKQGKSYWRNFLERNGHLVRAKEAAQLEHKEHSGAIILT